MSDQGTRRRLWTCASWQAADLLVRPSQTPSTPQGVGNSASLPRNPQKVEVHGSSGSAHNSGRWLACLQVSTHRVFLKWPAAPVIMRPAPGCTSGPVAACVPAEVRKLPASCSCVQPHACTALGARSESMLRDIAQFPPAGRIPLPRMTSA